MPPIRSVVFDVGETLMDDTTFWGSWADWLGVPRHTMAALVGAVTALGYDNAEALRLIRPGFDLAAERQAREDAGRGESITEGDLYPDVRPALSALRAAGLWVRIAGNQTIRVPPPSWRRWACRPTRSPLPGNGVSPNLTRPSSPALPPGHPATPHRSSTSATTPTTTSSRPRPPACAPLTSGAVLGATSGPTTQP